MKTILSLAIFASALSVHAAGVDANDNGLSDIYDAIYFGGYGDPFGDADGDGVSNYDEMLWGTNPTNAASFVTGPSYALVGGLLRLTWPIAPERSYELQASGDFANWGVVASGAVGAYAENVAVAGSPGGRSFRLAVNLPSRGMQSADLTGLVTGREFRLAWTARPGRSYEVQSSTDLSTWQTLAAGAQSPLVVNLDGPGVAPRRFYRLRITGGSPLEPWEEELYRQATGHALNAAADTDGDGLPDAEEFQQSRNFLKKDHPAVGLIVFTPLEK